MKCAQGAGPDTVQRDSSHACERMKRLDSRIIEEGKAIQMTAANSLSLSCHSAAHPLLQALIPSPQEHCGTCGLHCVLTVQKRRG